MLVRDICDQYSLPDPLTILANPLKKISFKNFVKSKVTNFWESKLRQDSSKLTSLLYFKPAFYSLSKPHPIWSSAGSNPYEVGKACCQARMLSGRYKTCWLARYWSGDKAGSCSLPRCTLNPKPGTLAHILVECVDLAPARQRVIKLWSTYLRDHPELLQVIKCYTVGEKSLQFPQLLLDCTVLPEVITLVQQYGSCVHDSLLYLTRSFCFSVHKARLRLLGKWNTL